MRRLFHPRRVAKTHHLRGIVKRVGNSVRAAKRTLNAHRALVLPLGEHVPRRTRENFAEREGFEPSDQFPNRTLSKRVP